ncbi:Peptidase family M23 [Candidatus Tiddalikarchaeum anstoanum]|nr:Peptidase family M23 [Candidatus Tiddalikarchaeum anstoanum]
MNKYSYPIEEKSILYITSKSPAHKKVLLNHEEYDLTNAIDFLCEEGTEVKAAFGGEVVTIFNEVNKNYNGFEEPSLDIMKQSEQDGNYVVLKHDNNEFSIYSHLKKDSIRVVKGSRVKVGDVLGYVGSTGWSIKPHLHFMVFKFVKAFPRRDYVSLKIVWKT